MKSIKEENNAELICPQCKGTHIEKNGRRKTRIGLRQRYRCQDCGKRFVADPLKNHLMNSHMLCYVCDLYFKGMSLRDIQDNLYQIFSFRINHETLRQNILKFVKMMDNCVNNLHPTLSKKWSADEQKVKCKGKWLWKWSVIDKATRYQIATTITHKRSIKEARIVFKKSKDHLNMDKRDKYFEGLEITTDGLAAYDKAIKGEFLSRKDTDKYVTYRPTTSQEVDKSENLLVERHHNQYREFDKVRRDFKTETTLQQYADGFRVYNNFIHQNNGNYLKGLTPAQAAGITITGKNRWLSLFKLSLSPELDKGRLHP